MSRFFSCDWGTTTFRLRHVNALTGSVLEERREAPGVRTLYDRCPASDRDQRELAFADCLRAQLRLIAGGNTTTLDGATVVISGMTSSSIGWRELPYARVPVGLDGSGLVQTAFELNLENNARVQVHLISGVRAEADMMRGEETEILGLFADGRHARLAEEGVVVLPGTHSKHVWLRQRQITGLRTYLTGELFDVLSAHSVLRASVGADNDAPSAPLSEPASCEAFVAGVRQASRSGLAGGLFQTRVRTVLEKVSPAVNRWFLSGLLIGSEVVDLLAPEPSVPILLAASEPLAAAYRLSCETIGLQKRLVVAPAAEVALASVRGHRELLRWGVERDVLPIH